MEIEDYNEDVLNLFKVSPLEQLIWVSSTFREI